MGLIRRAGSPTKHHNDDLRGWWEAVFGVDGLAMWVFLGKVCVCVRERWGHGRIAYMRKIEGREEKGKAGSEQGGRGKSAFVDSCSCHVSGVCWRYYIFYAV